MSGGQRTPHRIGLPERLTATGVVAIIRGSSAQRVPAVLDALVSAGVTCLELTLTMPGALSAITAARQRFGQDASIGAGTVLTEAEATQCLNAGAQFLIAPSLVPDVLAVARDHAVACIPGAFTPTEIVAGWQDGASAVKVFPAGTGGVRYLRDVRAPLPHIPLIPTGGVALEDITGYIEGGAIAVGLGSPLLRDCLSSGDVDELGIRAERALAAVRQGRDAAR